MGMGVSTGNMLKRGYGPLFEFWGDRVSAGRRGKSGLNAWGRGIKKGVLVVPGKKQGPRSVASKSRM